MPDDVIDGPSYSTIFEAIGQWCQQNPSVTMDVMLDLNLIVGKRQANILLSALKNILEDYIINISCFQNIVIAMTCFPESLSSVSAGETTFFERYEVKLFEKILNDSTFKEISHRLIFSDYGVTKFTDTDIDFTKMRYGILPKIRYTIKDNYVVLKGAKNHFTKQWIKNQRALALEVYNSDYYYGEDFSFGDKEIKERALGLNKKGPGNNTNWVTISANHHIAVVIEELSRVYGL